MIDRGIGHSDRHHSRAFRAAGSGCVRLSMRWRGSIASSRFRCATSARARFRAIRIARSRITCRRSMLALDRAGIERGGDRRCVVRRTDRHRVCGALSRTRVAAWCWRRRCTPRGSRIDAQQLLSSRRRVLMSPLFLRDRAGPTCAPETRGGIAGVCRAAAIHGRAAARASSSRPPRRRGWRGGSRGRKSHRFADPAIASRRRR